MRVLGVWSDHLPRRMHCETAAAYCSGGISTKLPCSLIKIVSALAGEPLRMGFGPGNGNGIHKYDAYPTLRSFDVQRQHVTA